MKSPLLKALAIVLACHIAPVIYTAVLAADAYPNKPVRLILPAAVSGSTDVVGRIIGMQLSERLGVQVVIVEYKSGGPAVIDLLWGGAHSGHAGHDRVGAAADQSRQVEGAGH